MLLDFERYELLTPWEHNIKGIMSLILVIFFVQIYFYKEYIKKVMMIIGYKLHTKKTTNVLIFFLSNLTKQRFMLIFEGKY